MYGTIARLKTKSGGLEKLKEMEARRPAGFIASYIYRMDADPSELWMVVIFESKEAYLANAESSQQHEEYMAVRARLTEEPEWHDGVLVYDSHTP